MCKKHAQTTKSRTNASPKKEHGRRPNKIGARKRQKRKGSKPTAFSYANNHPTPQKNNKSTAKKYNPPLPSLAKRVAPQGRVICPHSTPNSQQQNNKSTAKKHIPPLALFSKEGGPAGPGDLSAQHPQQPTTNKTKSAPTGHNIKPQLKN